MGAEAGLRQDGGREALRELLARETGPAAISAAGSVLRQRDFAEDVELANSAVAILLRALEAHGGRREAVHAAAVVSLGACGDDAAACERTKGYRALHKRAFDSAGPVSLNICAPPRLRELAGEPNIARQP